MTHADIVSKPGKQTGPAFLGFGCMRLPREENTVTAMTDAYLEAGFNYFDTAYIYEGSEEMLSKALVARHPRESYMIADKIPPWKVRSRKDCDKLFDRMLERLNVDYLDFLLVHSIDEDNERSARSADLYGWVAEQKKKGNARHTGLSFHGNKKLLKKVLDTNPELDFVQLQLNYMDVLRGRAGKLQETVIKYDKPIVVMEPLRGGALAKLPSTAEALMKAHCPDSSVASWACRYAATLPGVTCMLSGMSNLEQMQDNIRTFTPLSPLGKEETDIIEAVLVELGMISPIPCTGCKYCMKACPQQIEIAHCFSLYNDVKRGGQKWNLRTIYNTLPKKRRAQGCTGCGKCVKRCPQHINIPEELKKVTKMFK